MFPSPLFFFLCQIFFLKQIVPKLSIFNIEFYVFTELSDRIILSIQTTNIECILLWMFFVYKVDQKNIFSYPMPPHKKNSMF